MSIGAQVLVWAAVVLLLALPSVQIAIRSDRPFLPLKADLGLHAAACGGLGLFAYIAYRRDGPIQGWDYVGPAATAAFVFGRAGTVAWTHMLLGFARRDATRQVDHTVPVAFYTPDMPPASYQVEPAPKPMNWRGRLLRIALAPVTFGLWVAGEFRLDQTFALALIGLMFVAGEALGAWQLRRQRAAADFAQPGEARSCPGVRGSGR
jgi:hypothetical protein